MFESLLVALIVATAAVYAVGALTPAPTRNRLALRAAAALERRAIGSWLAARLRSLARAPTGGCASCPSSHAAAPQERAAPPGADN